MGKRHRYSPLKRAELIQAYHQSGQTKSAFAREQGISVNSLYRWLRTLPEPQPQFVELVAPRPRRGLVLRLGGPLSIEVPPDFDPETLRQLVATLC